MKSAMQKISAVIITFNEEKKIAQCLNSLQDIADEIVVLDSFSTDSTAQICKQFGVKFFQQNWRGYGQQKNDAAARASHDYIISLDADERLSSPLQQSIMTVKKAGLSGVYQMNRLNNFYGYDLHHGNTYPDRTKRIYNRTEVRWSLRPVHERLNIPGNILITQLEGDILHRSKDSIEEHVAGINAYSSMSSQVYFDAGKRSSLFKMLLSPAFTFINGYFLRLGFLDGYAGFIMAKINAQESFLKYSKLLLLKKNSLKNNYDVTTGINRSGLAKQGTLKKSNLFRRGKRFN